MRLFTSVLVLSTALLASIRSHAQNYRPFGPGRTYHYREVATRAGAPDWLNTLEIDSVYQRGTDSVFCFNHVNVPDSTNFYGVPVAVRANVFGGRLYWNAATGEAAFRTQHRPATVRLLTRGPVGQTWTFAPGVQAQLTARQAQATFGRPDTVLTVTLSDGRQLRLSRRWGLLAGPNFSAYLGVTYTQGVAPHQALQLDAIPELHLGATDMRWRAIFGFAPGDTLVYRAQWQAYNFGSPQLRVWRQRAIIGQQPLGNTRLRTQFRETTRTEFWSSDGLLLDSVHYTPNLMGADTTYLPTNAFLTGGAFWSSSYVSGISQQPDTLGGMPVGVISLTIIDVYNFYAYAQGLGQVWCRLAGMNRLNGFERLVGFSKDQGVIRWGNLSTPQPLATPRDVARLMVTVAPNPVAAGTTPQLLLSLDQPQAATVALYDALGREVWRQEKRLPGGEQRLAVGTHELPPGLYRLRLTLADGRQRVLLLVRE